MSVFAIKKPAVIVVVLRDNNNNSRFGTQALLGLTGPNKVNLRVYHFYKWRLYSFTILKVSITCGSLYFLNNSIFVRAYGPKQSKLTGLLILTNNQSPVLIILLKATITFASVLSHSGFAGAYGLEQSKLTGLLLC